MKLVIKLFLVMFFITSIEGCSKYEEGSYFTIIPKKARITNTWIPVKYVYSDGSVSTDIIEGKVTLEKDMSASLVVDNGGTGVSVSGTWKFIDDKTGINTKFNLLGYSSDDDYEIVKLTNKELWLRDQYNKVTHYEAK